MIIRLVDSLRPIRLAEFRAAAAAQFRCIPLYPAPDGNVIHAEVPLRDDLFQLPEAK
jgi:hypothetical protein